MPAAPAVSTCQSVGKIGEWRSYSRSRWNRPVGRERLVNGAAIPDPGGTDRLVGVWSPHKGDLVALGRTGGVEGGAPLQRWVYEIIHCDGFFVWDLGLVRGGHTVVPHEFLFWICLLLLSWVFSLLLIFVIIVFSGNLLAISCVLVCCF